MKEKVVFSIIVMLAALFAGCADYSLKAKAEPESVSPGGKGKLVISIDAGGKYHIDPQGIVIILFEPPDSISLEKSELRTEDRGNDGNFSTKFSVGEKAPGGPAHIKTTITFQLCTETQCFIKEEERDIIINVE